MPGRGVCRGVWRCRSDGAGEGQQVLTGRRAAWPDVSHSHRHNGDTRPASVRTQFAVWRSVTSGDWAGTHHTPHTMLDSLPEGLTRPAMPPYDPSFSHMMGKFWGLLSPPGSDGSGSQESDEQKIQTHSGR